MSAELLAMLGGASAVPSRREAEPKTLLSFKAGKMTEELQPDGRYLITADPRRGTIEVNWTASSSSSSSGTLKLEWKDRRTRSIIDSHTIYRNDTITYSKVSTGRETESENNGNSGGTNAAKDDRVYLLQFGDGASARRHFFWMQDKAEGNVDEENCVKINTYIADPAEASAAANGEESPAALAAQGGGSGNGEEGEESGEGRAEGGLDNAALMQIMQGISSNHPSEGGNANANTSSSNAGQVDTLSNILENLGMPQQSTSTSAPTQPSSSSTTTPAPSTNANATPIVPEAPKPSNNRLGGLTLSDLQGAMAGLATTSPQSSQPGPPLNEIATPESILDSGILSNPTVKEKLISLLPEGQQTEDCLMTNLRSPQVKQCLKSLTAALEEGESFNSILANFQLSPEDGAVALASGNPIQAFLDCVLKSVEREKEESKSGTEDTDGDAEMKE